MMLTNGCLDLTFALFFGACAMVTACKMFDIMLKRLTDTKPPTC